MAVFVGWVVARGRQLKIVDQLTSTLLIAMLAARIVFVAQYLPEYLANPWGIIDIRDGGFNLLAGSLAAILYIAWLIFRQPQARTPLIAATAAGLLTWTATGGAFLLLKPHAEGFPTTTVYSIGGKATSLRAIAAEHPGPVVINFWASWCPPCRAEMPMLNQAQHDHPDVLFIFVNQGEQASVVTRFLASLELSLNYNLLDPQQRLGQLALPTTLFYDTEGQLSNQHRGMLSKATLVHSIKAL